jgi:FkbM family methyltransferase
MTLNYDKKFIFNILKSQIENRAVLAPPTINPHELAANLFWESVCRDGVMHLNKAKYPATIWMDMLQYAKLKNMDLQKDYFRIMDEEYVLTYHWYAWPNVYADSVMIHHLFDDDYCEKNCEIIESFGLEGPYCFENVVVGEGDVVIDAGAFVGDWSAVAAQMGGRVYAFEPSPDYYARVQLHQTASLNNFKVVELGLGDMVCTKMLNVTMISGEQMTNDDKGMPFNLTTIDTFAEENNLHIDFIKSDIEGYERYMLKGASKVLKEDQPKLAIRTYHTFEGNDYEYLPRLIKEINPDYNIIMRKKTLYAYVE